MRLSSAEMLQEFVTIPSQTGSEAAFATYLSNVLESEFEYDHLELQEVAPGRHNILMVKGNPSVMLTSHIDTVPTEIQPYVEHGVLYGTGACDAKGQIVTQLSAIQEARDQGLRNYGCFYVVGEEVDSSGAQAIIEHPLIRGGYVLNGEPTGSKFVRRSKGVIEAIMSTTGVERHSSIMPLDSAIHKLVSDLNRLIETPPDGSTVNIGLIKGGTAANVSAAAAEAAINLRTTGRSEAVLEQIRSISSRDSFLKITNVIEPFDFFVPEGHQSNAVNVSFCSDAPYYAKKFKYVMMFGPGDIAVAHSIYECIRLRELSDASAAIAHLLLKLENSGEISGNGI